MIVDAAEGISVAQTPPELRCVAVSTVAPIETATRRAPQSCLAHTAPRVPPPR